MGLLQIDLKNAFNSVLRASVLRQVQQKAPHMFQWAKWSLGARNLLVCQEEVLYGVRGVQQGSPLGPLFFALALQEVLIELRSLFDDASWKIWYLDDGTIYGNLELLEQLLSVGAAIVNNNSDFGASSRADGEASRRPHGGGGYKTTVFRTT